MTEDEKHLLEQAQQEQLNYHKGTEPKGYDIETEYHDGSGGKYHADDLDEAWQYIAWLDRRGGFKSAWRDGEPWIGDCTNWDIP